MKRTLHLAVLLMILALAQRPVFGARHPGVPTIDGLDTGPRVPIVSTDWVPKLIPNPSAIDSYRRAKRTCTGVASIAITRGGRLRAAWYSGTTPGAKIESCPNSYVVVSTSGDGGATWKEVLASDPDGAGLRKASPRASPPTAVSHGPRPGPPPSSTRRPVSTSGGSAREICCS